MILQNTQNELQDLRTGKTKSITVDTGRRGRPNVEEITPEDDRWKQFSDRAIRQLETQEKYLKQDIEMYTKREADWKETDFKWEKKAK
jgi:hypothetical protein